MPSVFLWNDPQACSQVKWGLRARENQDFKAALQISDNLANGDTTSALLVIL
jgi:hypothetical protein